MLFSTILLTTLPLAVLGGNQHLGSTRAVHRSASRKSNVRGRSTYTLTDLYQGETFFDDWTFFTQPDPTGGNVVFLSQADATAAKLAYVEANGTVIMKVDDTTTLPVGANRNSVRITSNKSYNNGLFILDLYSMPHGCSVWPAWWTVGPNWPNDGEIDVIEGANNQATNQYTLHTGPGCTLDTTPAATTKNLTTGAPEAFSAHLLGTTCESDPADNDGCGFIDTDTTSYGHGFNDVGGGVYAHLWNDNGISMWHFSRKDIPADINAGNPDPTTWGPPAALFSSATCNIGEHFVNHNLVFDITLCGGFAGALYPTSGCPGTCAEAVADPSNFSLAKWKIKSLAVYN